MSVGSSDEPYNPHAVLEKLGIPVLRQWLRDTWGVWVPKDCVVVVADGLSPVEERCVLAHEIEHIHAGDTGCGSGPVNMRAEKRADVQAARKLIALSDFCAARQWAETEQQLAAELQVTPWMLRTRAADLEGRWLGTSRIAG
jgi:Zn-dependent peptidase ImmA (M78 family)